MLSTQNFLACYFYAQTRAWLKNLRGRRYR
nr:MAG TPA: hypothetical protein [Caudoviricetes sp.]